MSSNHHQTQNPSSACSLGSSSSPSSIVIVSPSLLSSTCFKEIRQCGPFYFIFFLSILLEFVMCDLHLLSQSTAHCHYMYDFLYLGTPKNKKWALKNVLGQCTQSLPQRPNVLHIFIYVYEF